MRRHDFFPLDLLTFLLVGCVLIPTLLLSVPLQYERTRNVRAYWLPPFLTVIYVLIYIMRSNSIGAGFLGEARLDLDYIEYD